MAIMPKITGNTHGHLWPIIMAIMANNKWQYNYGPLQANAKWPKWHMTNGTFWQ